MSPPPLVFKSVVGGDEGISGSLMAIYYIGQSFTGLLQLTLVDEN
jgi:hypothetical protein